MIYSLPSMYIVIDYFINISFIFEVILRVNALGKVIFNNKLSYDIISNFEYRIL